MLHGKLVQEAGGTVTFHSDPLGDVKLTWDKIKELHAGENFAVLNSQTKNRGKKAAEKLPEGSIDVTNGAVTVRTTNGEGTPAPIPVKDAAVIVDSADAGQAAESRARLLYGLERRSDGGSDAGDRDAGSVRGVGKRRAGAGDPDGGWLDSRNRTSADFSGSFGKITQPAYTSGGVFTPASVTKSSISHFDAERDEYVLGAHSLRSDKRPSITTTARI